MRRICFLAEVTVLSILALSFITTASAIGYSPVLTAARKGKTFIFAIDTTSDTTNGAFSGNDVIISSIVATVFDRNNDQITLDQNDIVGVFANTTYLEIRFANNDIPSNHVLAVHLQGSLYGGNTFYASAPGWQFGNVR